MWLYEQGSLRQIAEKIRLVAPSTFRHLSRDEIVTWARNRILHTFTHETAVVYTDFAAQIKHRADVKGTCEAEFSSNLDVAIVLHSPFMKTIVENGITRKVRCCKCAVWRAGSDSVGEAPFHMDGITNWLKSSDQVGTTLKCILVLTDR